MEGSELGLARTGPHRRGQRLHRPQHGLPGIGHRMPVPAGKCCASLLPVRFVAEEDVQHPALPLGRPPAVALPDGLGALGNDRHAVDDEAEAVHHALVVVLVDRGLRQPLHDGAQLLRALSEVHEDLHVQVADAIEAPREVDRAAGHKPPNHGVALPLHQPDPLCDEERASDVLPANQGRQVPIWSLEAKALHRHVARDVTKGSARLRILAKILPHLEAICGKGVHFTMHHVHEA
mmetsp:Transcript_13724/g.39162  ORF Transcript_13724/g.39162 Transcript_13724/m.39162 type:complete len:235 (+) Transcript_13724:33-737(+)